MGDARSAIERYKRNNDELRESNEKLTRKIAGLSEEIVGLQRSRDRWRQRAETAESNMKITAQDGQLEEVRRLVREAHIEAQALGGPESVATIPVSALAELLLPRTVRR